MTAYKITVKKVIPRLIKHIQPATTINQYNRKKIIPRLLKHTQPDTKKTLDKKQDSNFVVLDLHSSSSWWLLAEQNFLCPDKLQHCGPFSCKKYNFLLSLTIPFLLFFPLFSLTVNCRSSRFFFSTVNCHGAFSSFTGVFQPYNMCIQQFSLFFLQVSHFFQNYIHPITQRNPLFCVVLDGFDGFLGLIQPIYTPSPT